MKGDRRGVFLSRTVKQLPDGHNLLGNVQERIRAAGEECHRHCHSANFEARRCRKSPSAIWSGFLDNATSLSRHLRRAIETVVEEAQHDFLTTNQLNH